MPEKSVAEKLPIRAVYRVIVVNEAEGYRGRLGSLPLPTPPRSGYRR